VYDYNARYLNVLTGRFLSPDTITKDGWNRYEYARSNPLRYRDPSGHSVCAAISGVSVGIGGGIVSFITHIFCPSPEPPKPIIEVPSEVPIPKPIGGDITSPPPLPPIIETPIKDPRPEPKGGDIPPPPKFPTIIESK
jgi:hypothetical protein